MKKVAVNKAGTGNNLVVVLDDDGDDVYNLNTLSKYLASMMVIHAFVKSKQLSSQHRHLHRSVLCNADRTRSPRPETRRDRECTWCWPRNGLPSRVKGSERVIGSLARVYTVLSGLGFWGVSPRQVSHLGRLDERVLPVLHLATHSNSEVTNLLGRVGRQATKKMGRDRIVWR